MVKVRASTLTVFYADWHVLYGYGECQYVDNDLCWVPCFYMIVASASMLSVANAECHVLYGFMLIVIYGDCQVPVWSLSYAECHAFIWEW